MASASTPTYFRPFQRDARSAAAAAGLDAPYFRLRERPDEDSVRTSVWRSSDLSVPLVDVSGRWSVYLSYEFQNLPGDREVRLVRSSFGLTVDNVPFAADQPVTLLRYDYDTLLDSHAANVQQPPVSVHINVLQPDPLGDHLHLPAFRSEPWTAVEVMTWITSQRLLADLQRRLPA